MNLEQRERLEVRARVFKALGHASRLLIVQQLASGGRSVSELTQLLGVDVSTVSRHLSLLKEAGVLRSEKRGAKVVYSLRVPCVLEFLDCVERVLAAGSD